VKDSFSAWNHTRFFREGEEMMERTSKNQDNSKNLAKSKPSGRRMSSYAVTIADSTGTPKDASRPGAFAVDGPEQMDDRLVEEESEQGYTTDEVPLTPRNDVLTPNIPAAVLVDEDRELERDEALERVR
jgi:hypothetical protein